MKYGEDIRRKIEVYHSMGKNDRDISKIIKVPRGSVQYIRKKVLNLPSVYDEPIAKCRICGVVLDEKNWAFSFRRGNHRICKQCWNKRAIRYQRESVNWKRYLVEYQRKFSVHTSNGRIYGRKREPTGRCEICGLENHRLNYHHWDDNNLMKGMWLCRDCHTFIHLFVEKGYVEKYLKLKRQIETQTTNTNS